MALNDGEIERFARQILVPGIGAVGQARLCSSRVAIVGDPAGGDYADVYARAAGLVVVALDPGNPPNCAIVTDTQSVGKELGDVLATLDSPLVWYSIDAAGRLRSGVRWQTGQPLFVPLEANVPDLPAALHAVAACDAVNTAIGVLLGWTDIELDFEVELA